MNKHKVLSFACLACFIALSLIDHVYAENTVDDSGKECRKLLSLEEFRALAFSRTPLVLEIDVHYAEQVASAIEIESLPHPELQLEQTFTSMDLNGDNDSQLQVAISQAFRLSHFGSRSKVSELMNESGDQTRRFELLELSQKLNAQYHLLSTFTAMREVVVRSEKEASTRVAAVEKGVQGGLLSDGDRALFEAEKYRLQVEAASIDSKVSSLLSELTKNIRLECFRVSGELETVPEIPDVAILLKKSAANELSEAKRIELAHSLTMEQLRLAELDAYPEIAPRVVYQHTNDGGDYFGVGVSVPLPLWNRNQGSILRATAIEKAERAKLGMLTENGLEAQLRHLREAAVRAADQARIYTTKIVPSLRVSLKHREKLYAAGTGSVLDVWQIAKAMIDAEIQSALHTLEARNARSRLSLFIGEEL